MAPTLTATEARTKCTELAAKLVDIRSTPTERRSDKWGDEVRDISNELVDTDRVATILEGDEKRALETLLFTEAEGKRALEQAAWDAAKGGRSTGPTAAFGNVDTGEARSWGEQFTEADPYKEARDGGQRNTGEVEVRNLLTSTSAGTSGSSAFVPVGSPFLNQSAIQRLQFFLRDLIPAGPTNLTSIPYIRELNAVANETGALMVKEASAKPEVTAQFTTDDAPVRKIAAWLQVTEEAYADAPTLRAYIDGRLAYMLLVTEEAQMISGNGTAPNLKGITQFSGVQTQAATAGDMPATIANAIGKIENVDGMADGIAINPVTFWTQVATRHATWLDGGAYAGALPFSGPPGTLWGLPVVRTRSLASGKALVGAYRIGAQIFDKQGVTLKTTDSHASLFISNTLVVLAEKRVALAVHRPDFFVDTTIA